MDCQSIPVRLPRLGNVRLRKLQAPRLVLHGVTIPFVGNNGTWAADGRQRGAPFACVVGSCIHAVGWDFYAEIDRW